MKTKFSKMVVVDDTAGFERQISVSEMPDGTLRIEGIRCIGPDMDASLIAHQQLRFSRKAIVILRGLLAEWLGGGGLT